MSRLISQTAHHCVVFSSHISETFSCVFRKYPNFSLMRGFVNDRSRVCDHQITRVCNAGGIQVKKKTVLAHVATLAQPRQSLACETA